MKRRRAEPKRFRYDLHVPQLGGDMHGFTNAFTKSHVRAYIKKLYGMKSSVTFVLAITEV